MKVWVTKYALTKGITEGEGEPKLLNNLTYVRIEAQGPLCLLILGRDAHTTLEAAKAKAEAMRLSKIKSLHTQIKKLEKIRFMEEQK